MQKVIPVAILSASEIRVIIKAHCGGWEHATDEQLLDYWRQYSREDQDKMAAAAATKKGQ